jgi:transcriptional antiterminator NusG
MIHNGIEVDVSRALPAMDKAATKSRITDEYLHAASSDLVLSKPNAANWYCLQVMAGRESSVEKRLADAKIETVSPRERVVFVKNGRKFEGDRLFFPGYIIVRCRPSPEAFHGLRSVKDVLDIVGNMGKYYVLRDAEVSRFKDMTQIKAPRLKTDKTFAEGDRATITFGPFRDFDGLLLAVKYGREARARVMISVFGRQFEIDMPIAFLKKL